MILVRKLRKPGRFVAINYGRAGVSSTASKTLILAADRCGEEARVNCFIRSIPKGG